VPPESRKKFRGKIPKYREAEPVLAIKLREAMEAYRRRTGERMTYPKLSKLTGIAVSTLKKIGSRLGHRSTFGNVEKLCLALSVAPGDLLEIVADPPKAKRAAGRKRGGA
jgi:DNA-binding Xre family transcriptional regulator